MHPQISVPGVMLNISKPWTPKLIATVNNHEIKVAKISGAFIVEGVGTSAEVCLVAWKAMGGPRAEQLFPRKLYTSE
jgi:hypothetical protein